MPSIGARLSASLSAATILTYLAAIPGPSVMPRAHADTEDLDSIAATVNADYARNCGGRLHNNRDLGAIAQAYARSENANDLNDQRYPGQRDGFKGSGDPMAAALTDAYKRGVGNAISNCTYKDFGVGFVRIENREVDVVTVVFGIPPAATHVEQHVTAYCSPPRGQECFAHTSVHFDALMGERATVRYTPDPQGCSDANFYFAIDGKEDAEAHRGRPGLTIDGPEFRIDRTGGHDVSLRAVGIEGGCNTGTLQSWGGTVVIDAKAP